MRTELSRCSAVQAESSVGWSIDSDDMRQCKVCAQLKHSGSLYLLDYTTSKKVSELLDFLVHQQVKA